MDCAFRADFIVEDSIILELKTVDRILPIQEAQLLTYLKITGKKLGLLINFNQKLLRHVIRRIILQDSVFSVRSVVQNEYSYR
jgi:GxxExxY protein